MSTGILPNAAGRWAFAPPLQPSLTPGLGSNLKQKQGSCDSTSACPSSPYPTPLESPGPCNFNKLQQRAHALPHHSLADFLAAIVQSLLHFPPPVGCAPFAHSSLLKSPSSDPSEPVGGLRLFPKGLPLEGGPWCRAGGFSGPSVYVLKACVCVQVEGGNGCCGNREIPGESQGTVGGGKLWGQELEGGKRENSTFPSASRTFSNRHACTVFTYS